MDSSTRWIARRVTHDDAPLVATLARQAQLEYSSNPADVPAINESAWNNALYHHRVHAVLAYAPSGPVPVGGIIWRQPFSTWHQRSTIEIDELLVAPHFRRRGLGTFLLITLQQIAIDQDLGPIAWRCELHNPDAIAFYAAHGHPVRPIGVASCWPRDLVPEHDTLPPGAAAHQAPLSAGPGHD